MKVFYSSGSSGKELLEYFYNFILNRSNSNFKSLVLVRNDAQVKFLTLLFKKNHEKVLSLVVFNTLNKISEIELKDDVPCVVFNCVRSESDLEKISSLKNVNLLFFIIHKSEIEHISQVFLPINYVKIKISIVPYEELVKAIQSSQELYSNAVNAYKAYVVNYSTSYWKPELYDLKTISQQFGLPAPVRVNELFDSENKN